MLALNPRYRQTDFGSPFSAGFGSGRPSGGYNPDEPRDSHGRWTTGGGPQSGLLSGQPINDNWTAPTPGLLGRIGPNPNGQRRAAARLYGGRIIRIQDDVGPEDELERGIGDNQPPGGEPQPSARTPRAPQGWDTPGETVGGLYYPPGRSPVLRDGSPWPIATHDQIKSLLAAKRGSTPSIVVFVPQDGVGPLLLGSTATADFEEPGGYDSVTLRGAPQVTYSRGVETKHAYDSIDEALRLAATNQFSDIFFNRSFAVLSNRIVQSPVRPDVVAIARVSFRSPFQFHPYEVLSRGQHGNIREQEMPKAPDVARLRWKDYMP